MSFYFLMSPKKPDAYSLALMGVAFFYKVIFLYLIKGYSGQQEPILAEIAKSFAPNSAFKA